MGDADRLKEFEERQRNLEQRVAALESALAWQPMAAPLPQPATVTQTTGGSDETRPTALDGTPGRSTRHAGPDVTHRKADLESRIGTRWVALAGGAVLLLGTIFFLQLAFDRGWIGPMARLVLGWLAGASLWAGGEVLRRRTNAVYGQVVAATGVGVLYATSWVAFGVERYGALTGLGPEAGGLLLAAIALAAALHAGLVRAPILVSTSLGLVHLVGVAAAHADVVAMATTAVLGLGLCATAAWRRWGWLLVASQTLHVTLAIHTIADANPEWVFAASLSFLAATLVAASRQRAWWPDIAAGTAWMLGAFSLSMAVIQWLGTSRDEPAWIVLALGLAAAASVLVPAARRGGAVAAMALLVVWPLIHFEGAWPLTAWAVELGVLAWITTRIRHPIPAIAGIALVVLIGLACLGMAFDGVPWEGPYIAAFALAAASAWGLWAVSRTGPAKGIPALVVGLLVPMAAAAAFRDDPVVTLVWAIEATAALGVGAALRAKDLRLGGLAVIALMLGRIIAIDMADVDAVVRVLVFLAVGALLLGVGFAYARFLKRSRDAGPA